MICAVCLLQFSVYFCLCYYGFEVDCRFVLAFVLFAGTVVKLRQLWLERDKLVT